MNVSGEFNLVPRMSPAQLDYMLRWMDRETFRRLDLPATLPPDPVREAVGLPAGPDGLFLVAIDGIPAKPIEPGDKLYPSTRVGNTSREIGPPATVCCFLFDADRITHDEYVASAYPTPWAWILGMQQWFFGPWGIGLQGEMTFDASMGEIHVLYARVSNGVQQFDLTKADVKWPEPAWAGEPIPIIIPEHRPTLARTRDIPPGYDLQRGNMLSNDGIAYNG